MAELGEIERPPLENFKGKRKLYCVPNVYPIQGEDKEYSALVDKFWGEAALQIKKLEAAGKVEALFCEGVTAEDEEPLKTLEKLNGRAHSLVKERVDSGAAFFPLELYETYAPLIDWRNCLHIVRSAEAYARIVGFYLELQEKRLKRALEVIDGNLKGDGAGLLIMADEDRAKLQFPPDIEVFLVTPPSYDTLLKWLRDKMNSLGKGEAGAA